MSHGPGSDSKCDPNLTPLLDLVLQILMFFMVTVNFAQDQQQVSGNVTLPNSQTARPLSQAKDRDPIFLNLLKLDDPETVKKKVVEGKLDPYFPALREQVGEYLVEVPSVETDKDMTAEQRMLARYKTQNNAKTWLLEKYLNLKRDNKGSEVPNSIIIRADEKVDYAEVFKLLLACSEVGFRTLKVRAIVTK